MTEDTGVRTRTRVISLVAGIVRWVGLVAAIILAVHVVLTVGDANQANWITSFFRAWADPLALGFKDLFLSKPDADPKLRVLINYGLAAIFWLIISNILTRLLHRLA